MSSTAFSPDDKKSSPAELVALVDATLMSFDAGDKANGSMYVCEPPGGTASAGVIAALRAAGLWSDVPVKQVPEEHKAAYKAQLIFLESCEYRVGGARIVLLRGDHPKFPSDAARWEQWNVTLTRICAG